MAGKRKANEQTGAVADADHEDLRQQRAAHKTGTQQRAPHKTGTQQRAPHADDRQQRAPHAYDTQQRAPHADVTQQLAPHADGVQAGVEPDTDVLVGDLNEIHHFNRKSHIRAEISPKGANVLHRVSVEKVDSINVSSEIASVEEKRLEKVERTLTAAAGWLGIGGGLELNTELDDIKKKHARLPPAAGATQQNAGRDLEGPMSKKSRK